MNGTALRAEAPDGVAVDAFSSSPEQATIRGFSSDRTAVYGQSGDGFALTAPAKTGVYGVADQDATARGVSGKSVSGTGVHGQTTSGKGVIGTASGSTGTGVNALATHKNGFAVRASGRVNFAKISGVATIAAGATTVVITPGTDIVTTSYVIVTPQADPGTRRFWATVNATTDQITIRTNVSAASAIKVAYLILG